MSHKKQTFGERLVAVRRKTGLSVQGFAKRIGFNRTYIYRLEHEQAQNPSHEFLQAVSIAFKVNEEWLRTGEGKMDVSQATAHVDPKDALSLAVHFDLESFTTDDLIKLLDHIAKQRNRPEEFLQRIYIPLSSAVMQVVTKRLSGRAAQTSGEK